MTAALDQRPPVDRTALSLRPPRLPGLASAPHAIPYQGSKRRLAHAIVPFLPAGTARLLEPFAGSAAVSIAARHLGIVAAVEISDLDGPLMALWQAILADPAGLADRYARLWRDQHEDPRAYYEAVRARFNAAHEPPDLLYLLARCAKAAVRYNRAGQFNQAADHRRLGARPEVMRARLAGTARTLAGTRAYQADYAAVLRGASPADVVYLDPPYQGVTGVHDHRYLAGLPRDAFVAELRTAVARGTSFVLSYDGHSGQRNYGPPLPDDLGLLHLHVYAGASAQATLNGAPAHTIESLYLSPAIAARPQVRALLANAPGNGSGWPAAGAGARPAPDREPVPPGCPAAR